MHPLFVRKSVGLTAPMSRPRGNGSRHWDPFIDVKTQILLLSSVELLNDGYSTFTNRVPDRVPPKTRDMIRDYSSSLELVRYNRGKERS